MIELLAMGRRRERYSAMNSDFADAGTNNRRQKERDDETSGWAIFRGDFGGGDCGCAEPVNPEAAGDSEAAGDG
jgi:hypothetical protein